MRRALIATAGTVIGLVALLDYRSSSPLGRSAVGVTTGKGVTVAPGPGSASASTSTPTTAGPGATTPTTAPAGSGESGTFAGANVAYRYGDLEVSITVEAGRITAISVPEDTAADPRSQFINGQALPILTREALAAQSVRFDVVSGATYTSDAFAQSLQAALSKLRA